MENRGGFSLYNIEIVKPAPPLPKNHLLDRKMNHLTDYGCLQSRLEQVRSVAAAVV